MMLRLPSTSLPSLVAATALPGSIVVFTCSASSSLVTRWSTPPSLPGAPPPLPTLPPGHFVGDDNRLREEEDDHRHRERDLGHHYNHATEPLHLDYLRVVHYSEGFLRLHVGNSAIPRTRPHLRAKGGNLGVNLDHAARDVSPAIELGRRRRRTHSSSSPREIGSIGKGHDDDDGHAMLIPFIFLLFLFGVGLVCYGLTNLIPWAVRRIGNLVPCSCSCLCCPSVLRRRRPGGGDGEGVAEGVGGVVRPRGRRTGTPDDEARRAVPRRHHQRSRMSVEDRIAYMYGGAQSGITADLDLISDRWEGHLHGPGGAEAGAGASTRSTLSQPAVLAWMEMEVEEWRRRRRHIEAMMMMGAGPLASWALSPSASPSSSSHGRGASDAGGGLACGYVGEERRKLLEIVVECQRYEPTNSDRNHQEHDDAGGHHRPRPPRSPAPKVEAVDVGSVPSPSEEVAVATTDGNNLRDDDTSQECLSPPPLRLQDPERGVIKLDSINEGSDSDQEVPASTDGMENASGKEPHGPLHFDDDFVDDGYGYEGGVVDACSVDSGSDRRAGETTAARCCSTTTKYGRGGDREGRPSPTARVAIDRCRPRRCRRRRGSHEFSNESRERTCAICLDEFEEGEMLNVSKRCRHIFHRDCLLLWLERNDACPCCRTLLVTVDDLEKAAVGVLPPSQAAKGYACADVVDRSTVPSGGVPYPSDRIIDRHHGGLTLPLADEVGMNRQGRHRGAETMTQRRRPGVGDPFGLGLVTASAVPALVMDGGDYLGQEEWIEFFEDAYPSDGPDVANFDGGDR